MTFWHTLKFGLKSIALQRVAAKRPEEINRIQRRRLEKLVRHAQTFSPFYREKFAGLNPARFELSDIPPTHKSELMENFNDVLTVPQVRRGDVERFLLDSENLGKYLCDEFVISHTSGSQGQPLLLVQPKENIELLLALQAARGNRQKLVWFEVLKKLFRPARLAMVTLKTGFYPSAIAFEHLPASVRPYIDVLRLSVGDEDLVDRLAEFKPTHLTAYASILHDLARHIEEGRLSLKPELEQVVNISECLLPQVREDYQRVFGAPILDDYGMGECLFLSNGCSTSGGMHVNADWAILEVVDAENQPVPPGEPGEKVLLTNLANWAQPIIRYEIGDRVTMASEPCGCGSQMPLIARVEGRASELVSIETKSGVREISSGVFQLAAESLLDVREYQLVQTENNHVRVVLEPLAAESFDRDRAQQVVCEQLRANGIDAPRAVEFEVVDHLTRDGDNKFKRVIREDEQVDKKAS
jgi:phenylacetate-coenzyme A ligase PaaK-like adenylate-forming protein